MLTTHPHNWPPKYVCLICTHSEKDLLYYAQIKTSIGSNRLRLWIKSEKRSEGPHWLGTMRRTLWWSQKMGSFKWAIVSNGQSECSRALDIDGTLNWTVKMTLSLSFSLSLLTSQFTVFALQLASQYTATATATTNSAKQINDFTAVLCCWGSFCQVKY